MAMPITAPEQVTAKWLTDVLRSAGELPYGNITDVKIKSTKIRPYSRITYLEVGYSANTSAAKLSNLFLKLASPNEQQATSEINSREVEFYRIVGGEMNGPPLIKCYDAVYSPATGESHLLLDDLSETHFQTDQGEAPSCFYSELAIKCLAQFHAYWREHPTLGNDVGRFFDEQWLATFVEDLEKSVPRFLAFLGDELSTERRQAYQRMLASSRKIWGRLTQPEGLTLTHGDTHWWNFLYPKDPTSEQTRIFDWQLWHIDLGARDLAFLVALGGFAERRPEVDPKLLRLYHETLIANGVENYPWSVFWDDYRWSAIRNLNIPVIFWSQEKHESTWRRALERAFQAYNLLDCASLS
jgi:hypothetical protein